MISFHDFPVLQKLTASCRLTAYSNTLVMLVSLELIELQLNKLVFNITMLMEIVASISTLASQIDDELINLICRNLKINYIKLQEKLEST